MDSEGTDLMVLLPLVFELGGLETLFMFGDMGESVRRAGRLPPFSLFVSVIRAVSE